ncbi:MAG: hypothetical protein U0470_12165 [Anaerolineae bacterium]
MHRTSRSRGTGSAARARPAATWPARAAWRRAADLNPLFAAPADALAAADGAAP